MNTLASIAIRPLAPLEGLLASHLTLPSYSHLLRRVSAPDVVAIGAFHEGKPIGLGLASQPEGNKPAQLVSLFVQKPHRRQGLGRALVLEVEEELVRRGSKAIRLEYGTGMPARTALESLLRQRDWNEPTPGMLLCRADERATKAPFFQAPLFDRIRSGLPDVEVFPWEQLSTEEGAALRRQLTENPWAPPHVSPFQESCPEERSVCLGLRRNGAVVGWLITHVIAPTLIRYTWGYVHPDLTQRGAYVLLLREAIWQHLAIMPRGSQVFWGVLLRDKEMARFVQRRLAPYLVSLVEVCEMSKALERCSS